MNNLVSNLSNQAISWWVIVVEWDLRPFLVENLQSSSSSVITSPFEYKLRAWLGIAASFWPWLRAACKKRWRTIENLFFRFALRRVANISGKFISSFKKIIKKPFHNQSFGKSNKELCIKRNVKHRRGVRFCLFRVCTWKTSETHCRGVKAQIPN